MGKMEETWEKKDKKWPIDKWIFGLAIFVYYLMTFAFSRERNKVRKNEGKYKNQQLSLIAIYKYPYSLFYLYFRSCQSEWRAKMVEKDWLVNANNLDLNRN